MHIIGSVSPASGGPIEGILQQAAEQARLGLGVCEVVSLDRPDADYLHDFPLRIFALGTRETKQAPWARPHLRYGYTPRLIPWLREHAREYDAVIINGIWNYSAFAASRALPGLGVPYFVFTHGMLDPWFAERYPLKHAVKRLSWLLCEGPLLRNANQVLFTTEEERVLAGKKFPIASCRQNVVGYGIGDPPPVNDSQVVAFRAACPTLGDRPFLLFLSRIHSKKGCDLLIDAFGQLAAQVPDLDIVVAGPDQEGIRSRLMERAMKLGIAARVHWPGMLVGDAKWGAFRSARAFILPSHQENFGIVVAEALSCLTPVLITNKVNIWHEVVQGGAGFVENDDLEGACNLMTRFFALSHEELEKMGSRALDCFNKNFQVTSVVERLVRLIKQEKAKP